MFPIGIIFDSIDFKSKELEQQKVLGKKSAKLTIKINVLFLFFRIRKYKDLNLYQPIEHIMGAMQQQYLIMI